MGRLFFAYLLIALCMAAAIGWGFYRRYHGRERSYRRAAARDKSRREAKAETADR